MAKLFGRPMDSLHIDNVMAKSTDVSVEIDIERIHKYRKQLETIRSVVETGNVIDDILGDDPAENRILSKAIFLKIRQALSENQPVLEWSKKNGTSVFAGYIHKSLKDQDAKIRLLPNLTILKEDKAGKDILDPRKNMSAEFCEKIEILFSELETAQQEYLKLNNSIYKLQEKTLSTIISQEIQNKSYEEFRMQDHIIETNLTIDKIQPLPPAAQFKNLFLHPEFYETFGRIERSPNNKFVRLTIQSTDSVYSSKWEKSQSTDKNYEIRNEYDFAQGFIVECTKDNINVRPLQEETALEKGSELAGSILLHHIFKNAPKNFYGKLEESAKKVFCVKGEMSARSLLGVAGSQLGVNTVFEHYDVSAIKQSIRLYDEVIRANQESKQEFSMAS